MATRTARTDTATALIDAAEQIIIRDGYPAVTTRHVTEEAGQTHGLIRYHFGSLEGLLLATLRRATTRILDRQRELYAAEIPFREKWRTAMEYLESDLTEDGFPKLGAEILAMGWNDAAFRADLNGMLRDFTDMLADAVRAALVDYDIDEADIDVDAIATLIRTFQLGIMVERLAGVDVGHAALLEAIERMLDDLPRAAEKGNEHARK